MVGFKALQQVMNAPSQMRRSLARTFPSEGSPEVRSNHRVAAAVKGPKRPSSTRWAGRLPVLPRVAGSTSLATEPRGARNRRAGSRRRARSRETGGWPSS